MLRYMYIRDDKHFPVGCVAYKICDDGLVQYGISTHNPHDKFDRRIARLYAAARIAENPVNIRFKINERYVMIEQGILEHILSQQVTRYVSNRLIKTVRNMLPAI